jgi:hypothetical protein
LPSNTLRTASGRMRLHLAWLIRRSTGIFRETSAGYFRWDAFRTFRKFVDAVIYLTEAPYVTGEVLHVNSGAHKGRW